MVTIVVSKLGELREGTNVLRPARRAGTRVEQRLEGLPRFKQKLRQLGCSVHFSDPGEFCGPPGAYMRITDRSDPSGRGRLRDASALAPEKAIEPWLEHLIVQMVIDFFLSVPGAVHDRGIRLRTASENCSSTIFATAGALLLSGVTRRVQGKG
jgi:hypothetical protein